MNIFYEKDNPGVTSVRLEYTKPKELLMKKHTFIITLLLAITIGLFSCSKPVNSDIVAPYNLSYGDSILYLQPGSGDYIVYPSSHRAGVYSGFPEGIQIDDNTGAINVSQSETGLRYRITHTAPDGTVTNTLVVLSGINFTDHFYHLSTGDSVALPVYNASVSRVLPLSGSSFDEGNVANSGGCSIKTNNGQINLAQTVRNGIFGTIPQNDSRKDFDVDYRLNDGSGKALNKLKVRIYYYNTIADVAPDLLQTLQDRADLGVFIGNFTGTATTITARTAREAKPRPPCIIIVNQ